MRFYGRAYWTAALLAVVTLSGIQVAPAAGPPIVLTSTRARLAANSDDDSPTPVPQPEPEDIQSPRDRHVDGMMTLDEEEGYAVSEMAGLFAPVSGGTFYGGAEYLLAKPRFSQALFAEVQSTTSNENTTPEQTTEVGTSVNYSFNYNSNYRAFLGYRLDECGGDVQFTYWHLNNSTSAQAGPADVTGGTNVIIGQLDNSPADGQFLTGFLSVTESLYDIDFSKALPLGGGSGGCNCCGCPRWDVRWLAGVRIADLSIDTSNFVGAHNEPGTTFADYKVNFTGAGPHIGMQGRRYIGCHERLSLYAKSSLALLIGNYNVHQSLVTPGSEFAATVITQQNDGGTRMIPVVDFEVGGTWQVACCTYLSAGWFYQYWSDAGIAIEPCGTLFCPLSTANSLSFDGLFIRGEMLF